MAAKEKADHYTIIYGKDFLKELKNIIEKGDRELKYRVEDVIRELKKEPHKKRPKADIKLISSKKEGVYRVRIGDYRIVYEIDEKTKDIFITMIFHRGKGYGRA